MRLRGEREGGKLKRVVAETGSDLALLLQRQSSKHLVAERDFHACAGTFWNSGDHTPLRGKCSSQLMAKDGLPDRRTFAMPRRGTRSVRASEPLAPRQRHPSRAGA